MAARGSVENSLVHKITMLQAWFRGVSVRRHMSALRGEYQDVIRDLDLQPDIIAEWTGPFGMSRPKLIKKRENKSEIDRASVKSGENFHTHFVMDDKNHVDCDTNLPQKELENSSENEDTISHGKSNNTEIARDKTSKCTQTNNSKKKNTKIVDPVETKDVSTFTSFVSEQSEFEYDTNSPVVSQNIEGNDVDSVSVSKQVNKCHNEDFAPISDSNNQTNQTGSKFKNVNFYSDMDLQPVKDGSCKSSYNVVSVETSGVNIKSTKCAKAQFLTDDVAASFGPSVGNEKYTHAKIDNVTENINDEVVPDQSKSENRIQNNCRKNTEKSISEDSDAGNVDTYSETEPMLNGKSSLQQQNGLLCGELQSLPQTKVPNLTREVSTSRHLDKGGVDHKNVTSHKHSGLSNSSEWRISRIHGSAMYGNVNMV